MTTSCCKAQHQQLSLSQTNFTKICDTSLQLCQCSTSCTCLQSCVLCTGHKLLRQLHKFTIPCKASLGTSGAAACCCCVLFLCGFKGMLCKTTRHDTSALVINSWLCVTDIIMTLLRQLSSALQHTLGVTLASMHTKRYEGPVLKPRLDS